MVPQSILKEWYNEPDFAGDTALLDRGRIEDWFGSDQLVHLTTQDEDEGPDIFEWIEHHIQMATVPLPSLSSAFALKAGVVNPKAIPYVAGNGQFDSSFPLLIYRQEDHVDMEQFRAEWRALFDSRG
jgi:hypothetical protein